MRLYLVMGVLLLQSVAVGFILWDLIRRKAVLVKAITFALGIAFMLLEASLVLFSSSDFLKDRELIVEIESPEYEARLEVYRMGMHDHVALEFVAGRPGGLLAKESYFEDHFDCTSVKEEWPRIYFLDEDMGKSVVFDAETFTFERQ